MKPFARTLSLLVTLLAFEGTGYAQARNFRVIGGSRIQFVSDAPLERITGASSTISGQFSVDAAQLSATRGQIAVPVASIRTGMDLRDEHLRGSGWLDSARFANVSFEIVRVVATGPLLPNQTARVQIVGRLTVHGQAREVTSEAQVRLVPLSAETRAQGATSDMLRVQARFTVNLTAHGISVPGPVRLKVANEIQVNVTIRAQAS